MSPTKITGTLNDAVIDIAPTANLLTVYVRNPNGTVRCKFTLDMDEADTLWDLLPVGINVAKNTKPLS